MTNSSRAIFCLLLVLCIALKKGYSDLQFTEGLFASVSQRYGQQALERVRSWQQLTITNRNASIEDQLFEVNKFFNRVDFVDDIEHWNTKDYWATPIEFLGTNGGDCEDFVIAKYFTLIHLGVPSERLRLMYVTATRPKRQAHMVLAYYPDANAIPLVLDNINKRILPATSRRDLIPVYSFNADGLWLAKSQGRGRKMQGQNNNSMWADLNARMQQGG